MRSRTGITSRSQNSHIVRWRKQASLTTPALSIPFFSTLLHALREERHFALVEGVAFCFSNHRLARNQFQVRSLDPTHASLRSTTAIMITTSNSSVKRSGTPIQLRDVLLHTIACSGLSRVRTEFHKLLVIPSLAPHPKQTNR